MTPYQAMASRAGEIRRNEAGVRVEGTGMGTDSTRARWPGALRLVLLAGVLLAGAVGAPAGAFLPPLRRSRRLAAAAVVLATGLAAGAGVAVAWSARQERLGAHAAEPAAQDRAAAAGDVHSRHGA